MIRVVLLAAALVVPSRIGAFDGVPLDGPLEFALLVLVIPLVFSRDLRERADALLRPPFRTAVTTALGTALALKLLLLAFAPNGGFESCYFALVGYPEEGCEITFADPFRLSGATRVDEKLDFGPLERNPASGGLTSRVLLRDGPLTASEWNLSFFNDHRFNWNASSPGLPDRNRLPFSLEARGEVELDEPGLAVAYVGSGHLTVDERTVELPASYERRRTVTVPVPAGRHELELDYGYREIAETGEPPATDPYAELSLTRADGEPLGVAGPGFAWRAAAALVTAVLAAAGLGLLALFTRLLLRPYWRLALALGPLVALGVAFDGPHSVPLLGSLPASVPYVAALAVLMAGLAWRPGPHPMLAAWIGVAAVAAVRTVEEFANWGTVLYPNGGDDPLIYESQAMSILDEWSLEGREPVFGFQPGYRYFLFAGRLLLGPTAQPLSLLALAGMAAGVFFLVDRLRAAREGETPFRLAALAAGILMLAVLWSDMAVGNLRAVNSEWVSWILFAFGAGLLLGGRSRLEELAGGALLCLEGVVRLNQLTIVVALLGLYVVTVARGSRRTALVICAVCGLVLLLPAAHNVIYGGKLDLVPNVVGPVNQPSELVDVFSDEYRRERVLDQVALSLYLPAVRERPPSQVPQVDDLQLYVAGLELLWLAAIAAAIAYRRRLTLPGFLALGLPIAALLPYVFYSPISYYPRHVVIVWLAMGLSVLLLCRALIPGKEEGRP